ncbi:hypothetical protein SUGI_1173440 [Cryptomeria japonica]|nr:hypothetical protein SUGI_1173440 [Cryptomeria japonica]
MRELMHGHNVEDRDWIFNLTANSDLFVAKKKSGKVYAIPDYNKPMEHQREMTMKRIDYLLEKGVFKGIRIADCSHKIGLNGVDNGRIWFDNLRIPRENILNSVADVSPDCNYQTPIIDPDQRFAAFMAPLITGRVTIAVSAIYQSKIGLAIATRYALTRRAFNLQPDEPEILLLDYPSHQRRLLPLLAKTYAMSCETNDLKRIY